MHHVFDFEIHDFEYLIPEELLHKNEDEELAWESTLQLCKIIYFNVNNSWLTIP